MEGISHSYHIYRLHKAGRTWVKDCHLVTSEAHESYGLGASSVGPNYALSPDDGVSRANHASAHDLRVNYCSEGTRDRQDTWFTTAL